MIEIYIAILLTVFVGSIVWLAVKARKLLEDPMKLMSMLNTMPMVPPEPLPNKIIRQTNCVIVEFYIENEKFQVYLPKDSKLIGKEVYLIKSNQSEVKLLQPRDVKYVVTAKELGGIGFRVYDKETDISTRIEEDQII